MTGKTLKMNILFISFFFLCVCGSNIYAQTKKDVTDPVLAEILAFFKNRMPRFINQHGEDIFVADDQVTRGSLIKALYEYDKSLRYAGRQDVNEVRERMVKLEKEKGAVYDITKITTDLGPAMPSILDKSLGSSKVFSDFKANIEKLQAEQESKTQTENFIELKKRVEKIENSLPIAVLPSTAKPQKNDETKDLYDLKERIAKLEKEKVSYDIAKIARDIGPAMPSILDKSLNSSKVFSELKTGIKNKHPAEPQQGENKAAADNLAEISKRVEKLEAGFNAAQMKAELIRMDKRIERLEGGQVVKSPQPQKEKDLTKLIEKIDLLTEENRSLEERVARFENRGNIPQAGLKTSSQAGSANQETAELNKRIDKVERAVLEYSNFEKDLARLEEKINSVERISSLGNVSSSEELSGLKKRVSELERTQQNAQNK